jgi:hypothetical protein
VAEAVDRLSRLLTKCLIDIVESCLHFCPLLLTSRWLSNQHALLDRLARSFPAVQVFAARSRPLGRQCVMPDSLRLQPLPLSLWSARPLPTKAIYTTTMMKSVNQFTCKVVVHMYADEHPPQRDLSVTSSPFWGDRPHLDLTKNARLCYSTALLSVTHADSSPIIRLCIIPSFSFPATLLHFPAKHLLVSCELSTCLDLRRDQRWPGPPPTRSLPTHAPPSQHAHARHAYGL